MLSDKSENSTPWKWWISLWLDEESWQKAIQKLIRELNKIYNSGEIPR